MTETTGKDTRTEVTVDVLARVEGEGGISLKLRDGRVSDVRLNIFEPPRFFEALLEGRQFTEAPDITSRICGICPIAYQMSACQAMESACGVRVDGALAELRRLIYCGEWIESHALHVFMLHAPDFLGFESAIHMSAEHPELVQTALKLKSIGNELMEVVGGRAVHPVNVRVGGFYRLPGLDNLQALVPDLEWGRAACVEVIPTLAALDFPDFEPDYEFVAMHDGTRYPITEGRLVSSRGLDIAIEDFNDHFVESHVPHSNALHCQLRSRGNYLVGPLARYNLNAQFLSPLAQQAALDAGLGETCSNPFRSILVRAVELAYAFDEALRIVNGIELPQAPAVDVPAMAGTGHGCTEAPRGILYHRYQIDEAGSILNAQIVPPTSQNQASIESDLRSFAEAHLDLTHEQLQWQCEQAVRNYDPCISCATHFLTIDTADGGD